MAQSKRERSGHLLVDFWLLLLLAVVVLMVFLVLALAFIFGGSEKWVLLGFKILEHIAQMVLVVVLGGVLVQAYVKWHSRRSSINEFRKATAEALINEYSRAKKVRRLLRANCIQDNGENRDNPWAAVPMVIYDMHMGTINDVQISLEVVKRRLKFFHAVFHNSNDLSSKAEDMEKYLGLIIKEYERHRNSSSKRDVIPLLELNHLRRFILRAEDKESDFSLFAEPFEKILEYLETEGVFVAL